jgi:hypothetical protein
MEIGESRIEAARAVDMRRETRRVPAGPLQVRLGEDIREGTRIVCVHGGSVTIQ